MKTIASIILFASVLMASAVDRITATVTVTNMATNGQTLVVNAATRTWTNTVYFPATQIQATNTIGATATNLWRHCALNNFTPHIDLALSGTNAVLFYAQAGQALTITATDWGTVNYVTNSLTNAIVPRLPITVEQAAVKTNIASMLADALNYSTNAIHQTNPVASELVGLTNAQTVTGTKFYAGPNTYSNASQLFVGGVVSNVTVYANGTSILSNATQQIIGGIVSNLSGIYGTNGLIVNVVLISPMLTNGVNYGTAFSSPGLLENSEQFGRSTASGTNSLSIGFSALASATYATAAGPAAIAQGVKSTAMGYGSEADEVNSSAFGWSSLASAPNTTAVGTSAQAIHENSTALGYGAQTDDTNQVMIGTASVSAKVNNRLDVGGVLSAGATTNAWLRGTNTLDGDLALTSRANTALANNTNAGVVLGTNVYVRLSGATTNFGIAGFAAERDGSYHILQFSVATGSTISILNDSGIEPTAANRILTGSGGDWTFSYTTAMFTVVYDATASRWRILTGVPFPP